MNDLKQKFKLLPERLDYAQICFMIDRDERQDSGKAFWPYEEHESLLRQNDYKLDENIIKAKLEKMIVNFENEIIRFNLNTEIVKYNVEVSQYILNLFELYIAINDIQNVRYQNFIDFCNKVNLNPESVVVYDNISDVIEESTIYQFLIELITDLNAESFIIEHSKYLKCFDKDNNEVISGVLTNYKNINLYQALNEVNK